MKPRALSILETRVASFEREIRFPDGSPEVLVTEVPLPESSALMREIVFSSPGEDDVNVTFQRQPHFPPPSVACVPMIRLRFRLYSKTSWIYESVVEAIREMGQD